MESDNFGDINDRKNFNIWCGDFLYQGKRSNDAGNRIHERRFRQYHWTCIDGISDERTRKFKVKLIPFIKGTLKFFNNYTNIELNKKLIIADVYELGEENMKYGMYLFTELFWDKIKINRIDKKHHK